MAFRQFCVILCFVTLLALAVSPSLAQDKQNYDIHMLQNLFKQTGQNSSGTDALSQVFSAFKNIFGSSGNQTNGNATVQGNSTKGSGPFGRLHEFTTALKSAFASPAVQQVVTTGETLADAFLQGYLEEFDVSEQCYDHLKLMVTGLFEGKDWPLRSKLIIMLNHRYFTKMHLQERINK